MNSKVLLLLPILLFIHLSAKEKKNWDFEYFYKLKKDQFANIYINRNGSGDKTKSNSYLLSFRWTLYDGSKNLIVLLNYQGYPYQYSLRQERLRDRIEIPLLYRSKNYVKDTYALIVFSNFNKKKMTADFDVYIRDRNKKLLVDFKKGK